MFAAISPLIDLALIASILGTIVRVKQHGWAQTSGDVWTMGLYWLAFTGIDMLCGWVAYALDNRDARYPPHLMVATTFVYRQSLYWGVVRAIESALGGRAGRGGERERYAGRTAGREEFVNIYKKT